ncbi:GlsB/YeaQ/YmgE family stress response membrane protein [Rhizobium sp.]
MDLNGVGWVGAILVGGVAGWLAEMFMRSNMGILMNILLGIVGAAALNFVLERFFQMSYTGLWAYLIIGFIGACILIALGRNIRR